MEKNNFQCSLHLLRMYYFAFFTLINLTPALLLVLLVALTNKLAMFLSIFFLDISCPLLPLFVCSPSITMSCDI